MRTPVGGRLEQLQSARAPDGGFHFVAPIEGACDRMRNWRSHRAHRPSLTLLSKKNARFRRCQGAASSTLPVVAKFNPKSSGPDMSPIRDVIERFGDRWSIPVLCALAEDGPWRFNALRGRIEGISQRMLAQTLRRLEQDGFLSRSVYPTNPPRVQYALTPLGRSALEPVWEMVRWASQNHGRVLEARRNYVLPARQQAQPSRDPPAPSSLVR